MSENLIPTILQKFKRPWKIVAPMVDYSDEAFRILLQRNGADFSYSQMIHCKAFLHKKQFDLISNSIFTNHSKQNPFIIQVAGSNADELLKMCKVLQEHCHAIDINFGCPQNCAKKSNYGAFLMNDFERIKKIVKTLSSSLRIPVFCKIRVFKSIEKSIELARLIEDAGCKLLAVHGRTIDQKGILTGLPNLEIVKRIKEALKIPVITNGGVLESECVYKNLKFTKCDGIMVAEPLLFNPMLFANNKNKNSIEIAKEYININYEIKTTMDIKSIRNHFHKFFMNVFNEDIQYRKNILNIKTIEDAENYIKKIEDDLINGKIKPQNIEFSSYIRK